MKHRAGTTVAGRELPALDLAAFERGLVPWLPPGISEVALAAMWAHYDELRRWSPKLALIGPGTAGEVLERHFGESLAALPLLPAGPARLLDLGSGAGFPGLVLAAARPDLDVTLVEARERKWAFLLAAARRASLSCQCLNARVDAAPPEGLSAGVDVVTVRALSLTPRMLDALVPLLAAEARVLLWSGASLPAVGSGFAVRRELALAGSARRRIVELARETPR